jgi:protein-S-isoprenylcysteine O-methyltransferase Ste14
MSAFATILIALWVISEITLGVTRRSGATAGDSLDRSSLRALWITISLSVTVGVLLAGRPYGALAGPRGTWENTGVVLIVAGLAIRWAAILSLKRSFTVDVAVAKDQRVVETGLYRWIRHPSYAGSLLSFVGFGLALRHWTSLAAIVVPITAAFLYRIGVEEAALRAGLGEAYAAYARRTRRLVPFVY